MGEREEINDAAILEHRAAAILSIGDELILGQTLDTNCAWLAGRLLAMGIEPVEHCTVDDDADAIAGAIRRLALRVQFVVVTGGLGPTADDLTREAMAQVLGEELSVDAELLNALRARYESVGVAMPMSNERQALRPASAQAIANLNGTAPGLWARVRIGGRACDVACLPGPPGEMQPMFEARVAPRLAPASERVIRTRVLRTFGMGESAIADLLGDLMDRSRNPLVGTTASKGIVSCRLRYEGLAADAAGALEATAGLVREKIGGVVFGEGYATLAGSVVEKLRDAGQRVVVVESCTGGGLGAAMTAVAGSSDVFVGGWVTYSDEMKMHMVGVREATLRKYGAVSEQTAREMALGGLLAVQDMSPAPGHALAITGIAGPGGGSEEKPVGTVYIARASRDGTASDGAEIEIRRFVFVGGREMVRHWSALSALGMLYFHLTGESVGKFVRQSG